MMQTGPFLVRKTHSRTSLRSESALEYHKYLTRFQIEKFTYLFEALFDIEKNGLLEKNDIDALVEKIRIHAEWEKTDENFRKVQDVFRIFYECLLDQVRDELAASSHKKTIKTWQEAESQTAEPTIESIKLTQWLNMWGKLCHGASGVNDFPIWVQLLPNIFFDAIDVDRDDVISINELRHFYKDFVLLDEDTLEKTVQEGFRAMTANGDYALDRENYFFVFSNFLLGRTIYGPGKYLFGCFDNREIDEVFKIRYNEGDE